MEKNIIFSTTQELPWCADPQKSLLLGSQILPQLDPKADVKIIAGQLDKKDPRAQQTSKRKRREQVTKTSYMPLQGKTLDVAQSISYPSDMQFSQLSTLNPNHFNYQDKTKLSQDQTKRRNQVRQNLNTMPTDQISNENKILFTGQGTRKFRVVVLPAFGKDGNGPSEQKSKAMWTKIQQNLSIGSAVQPQKDTNVLFSHQRSLTTLANFRGGQNDFELPLHDNKSGHKQNKFLLRTDKRLILPKAPGFLASVGGKKTFGANFALQTNQILSQELQKAEQADQIAIYTGMNVDQRRKNLPHNEGTETFFYINKESNRKLEDQQLVKLSPKVEQRSDQLLPPKQKQIHLTDPNDSLKTQQQDVNAKTQPVDLQQEVRVIFKSNSRSKLKQIFGQASKLAHPQLNQGVTIGDLATEVPNLNKQKSTKQNDDGNSYPEIFDRAERTLAATFANVGNLNYFTPSQRIGCFMEFTLRLKRRNLLDLIAYVKLQQNSNRREEEDDEKTDQDYKEQSLFHGLMLQEQVETRKNSALQAEAMPEIVSKLSRALSNTVKAYDPCISHSQLNLGLHKVWSKVLTMQLETSMKRFLHYVQSPDLIKNSEISQYRKEWMTEALLLVSDTLMSEYSGIVKTVFLEIFRDYQIAMKVAILEYILLSPNERKRLNIIMLPKVVPTAAEVQVQFGGYSTAKFHGTHYRKLEAERQIKLNLTNNNIVVSSLLSWAQEFRFVRLVDFSSIKEVVRIQNQINKQFQGQTIDIDNAFAFFDAYLQKSVSMLRNLWYRGAILIIKKFKWLKSQDSKCKQIWTFKGPATDSVSRQIFDPAKQPVNTASSLMQYNLFTSHVHQNVHVSDFSYDKDFSLDALPLSADALNENLSLEDLLDIRQTPAYLRFVKSLGQNVNLSANGYEHLDKQYKRELKFSAGNLIQSQLREIVDRSVLQFAAFFRAIPTYKSLKSSGQIQSLREMKSIVTKIKQQTKLTTVQQAQQKFGAQTFNKDLKKLEAPAPENNRDPELRLPEFLNLQDFVNPIFKIQLLLRSDRIDTTESVQLLSSQLTFNKQPDDILKGFEQFFDSLVNCVSELSRPEFCKIKVISKKVYSKSQAEVNEQQDSNFRNTLHSKSFQSKVLSNQQSFVSQGLKEGLFQEELAPLVNPQILDFDVLMYSSILRDKQAYQNFYGRIQLLEAAEDRQVKSLYDQNQEVEMLSKNANAKVKVNRRYTHVSASEECYRHLKQQLLKNIELHVKELNMVKSLYEQFQELIDGSLKARVLKFVSDTSEAANQIDKFKCYVDEIHYFRTLMLQLPERVAFPLFEVGLLQVKLELKQRVEHLLFVLLSSFERNLLNQSTEIVSTFQRFANILSQNIATPLDVVNMEQSKLSIIAEMSKLQSRIAVQKRCFFFLITQNDQHNIFCEPVEENGQLVQGHCYRMVQQTLLWPAKIQQIIANAEDRHQDQRSAIENQVSARLKSFDKEILEFQIQLKKQSTYSDLKNYQRAYAQVKETKLQIDAITRTAAQLEIEEKQLFGSSQKSKLLQTICESFEPNYLLWRTAKQLMQKINKWQGTPMDEIQVTEVQESLQSCADNIEKLSLVKSSQADQENIQKVLAQLQREHEKIKGLFDIIKVLSSDLLQEFHWDKIKQLVGSDSINLKKMNLVGVIALDMQSLTQELNEILRQAVQFSQTQANFSAIQNDWTKRRLETVNIDETTNLVFDEEQLAQYKILLADNIRQIDSMISEGNKGPLTRHLEEWSCKLINMSKFIQVVSILQERYISEFRKLSRIEQLQDSSHVDGSASEKFSSLDLIWQQTLAKVQAERYLLNAPLKQDFIEKLKAIIS